LETVNSLLERRERQSRNCAASELSLFSFESKARRASLKMTRALRKYSRIKAAG
jgi:hypothetical protein